MSAVLCRLANEERGRGLEEGRGGGLRSLNGGGLVDMTCVWVMGRISGLGAGACRGPNDICLNFVWKRSLQLLKKRSLLKVFVKKKSLLKVRFSSKIGKPVIWNSFNL